MFDVIGYWALGVVVVALAVTIFAASLSAAGDYMGDLSDDIRERLTQVLLAAVALAACYLAVWGCYKVGEWTHTLLTDLT